jgi:molybdopterin converting factor small subunit
MRVHIPSPLLAYTAGRREVEGEGATVGELLADLDERHRGLRFRIIDEQDRIRPHIRLFVGARPALDLGEPVMPADEVHILCALSGG